MSATRNRGFSGAAELPIKQSSDCRSRKDVGELSERKPGPYTKRRRVCHVRHAHWRNRPAAARYSNVYRLRRVRTGTARPTYLKVFSHLEAKRAEIVAWVVTCCLVRSSFAILGTAKEWALLLDCHHNTVRRMLAELCAEGWLVRTPMFVRKKCVGRRGQKLFHFERCSWYGPSQTLRLCFRAYQAGHDAFICEARKAARKVRPICNRAQSSASACESVASHGDPPILGEKRSLLAHAVEQTTTRAVSDGAGGALEAAGQEGIAKRGPSAPACSIGVRRLTDKKYTHKSEAADIALIQAVAVDRSELRDLMQQYRDNADLTMRLVSIRAHVGGLL